MSPAKVAKDGKRGWIVPVGGAEDKEGQAGILRRFLEISGGKKARIAIVPTASSLADTGRRYERLFSSLGADEAVSLPWSERSETDRPDWLKALEASTGIFLTGGNQLRLSTLLGGTGVARTLRALNASGVSIAGTSAGAAFLCEHMIAFGDEGASPQAGSVTLAPGLGLTNRVIIDMHFRQRDRLGRLITALAYNPFAVGIGLDEDTAAFIGPDETIEVEGSGGVTVVDASDVSFSSMSNVSEGQPVCMLGLKLHILVAGATFNLHTRLASAGSLAQTKE